MKTMDTLTDILQLAKTVESTVQMETLSKQLLQNVGKLNTTTEVHAVQKHHHSKNKHFQSNSTGTSGRKLSSKEKGGKKCGVIVVIPTFQSNVLPTAKNVSNAGRIIISQNFVGVQRKSQVVGLATLNVFQGKMFMKWKSQSLNMTLILWSLNESCSQHLCLTPQKILQTLSISCLIKCQASKKVHHALTDVNLENRAGISHQLRFKLDTEASGNVLPVSVYHELFPDCNMKDLGKTIDKSVQLLTTTKSSVAQLDTVCLGVLSLPV